MEAHHFHLFNAQNVGSTSTSPPVSTSTSTSETRTSGCHLCGLDYPVKQSLVKHMSKFHSDAATQSEAAGGSGEIFSCKYCELTSPFKVVIHRHQLTHKKEMGHQCEICQKCYTSDAGLRRHIRINHPAEEEVVECPFCRKPFGNKDYMQDHMKKFCQVRKATEAAGGATSMLPEEPQPAPFKLESYQLC